MNQHANGTTVHKLSPQFRGALGQFALWIANGTVGHPLLDGVDYSPLLHSEPSALEMVFAIYANVIELDGEGNVLNAKWAEHRAAQHILAYMTGTPADPPFEEWEKTLHGHPPRNDVKPWPV
jgi:hypothetical protein